MEDRADRDCAPGRRRGDWRDFSSDRGFVGASRGSIRGVPIRDRSIERDRADLEEGTLRGRRSMDWLPDVASATPGIAHQQAALAVSGASLLVSLMGFGPANVTLALTYVARHVTVWAVIETFRHKGLRELHET